MRVTHLLYVIVATSELTTYPSVVTLSVSLKIGKVRPVIVFYKSCDHFGSSDCRLHVFSPCRGGKGAGDHTFHDDILLPVALQRGVTPLTTTTTTVRDY